MPRTQNPAVRNWIIVFCSFAVFLVVYGGFVRLTRSGLSITEWNPIMGAIPPLSQQSWQAEFAKYQSTPEFQKINFDMTLPEYKEIFLIEWLHRILARLAGLVFAIPFFVFLVRGAIPLKEAGLYVVMGLLFLAQAVMGWVMVASGLIDRPAVSHYLLTAHLFLALTLIGLSIWTLLGHVYGFPEADHKARWSRPTVAAFAGLLFLLVQIAYGGFTAGLKAGHVSNTWPLMLGRWIPGGLLTQVQPAAANIVQAPLTVAFIHRWLAVVVLAGFAAVYWTIRRVVRDSAIRRGLVILLGLCLVQIALGILVVVSNVEIGLALAHQLNAIGLFIMTVYLLNRLRSRDFAGNAEH
jgi:cytochrome c oxidase assembly protein subunit 15